MSSPVIMDGGKIEWRLAQRDPPPYDERVLVILPDGHGDAGLVTFAARVNTTSGGEMFDTVFDSGDPHVTEHFAPDWWAEAPKKPKGFDRVNLHSGSLVLIWSNEHNAWWAPGSRGYTVERSKAGLYRLAEAEAVVANANAYLADDAVPHEAIVPALDPERAPSRETDLAARIAGLEQDLADERASGAGQNP